MRKKLIITVAAMSMILVLIGAASLGLVAVIQHGVGVAAEREAVQWAQYLTDETPDLESLLQADNPDQDQLSAVLSLSQVSDVFRFELFNQQGDAVVWAAQSDDGAMAHGAHPHQTPHIGGHLDTVQQILAEGGIASFIHDETADATEPKYFIEAYTPIVSGEQVIGVAIVYVDKTAMYRQFTSSAIQYSIAMSALFAVILAVAYFLIAYLRERQKTAKRSIEYLANFDTVSGLLNRDAFFKTASLASKANCVAVLYADVDNFKSTNDVFGHQTGDAFLRHVGEAIARGIGETGVASRIGGDEFVAVIAADSPQAILAVVDRVQQDVKLPLRTGGVTVTGGISVGVYMVPDTTVSVADCLHKADMALYQAKADGRGLHKVFNQALEATVARRQKVEKAVRQGYDLDLFTLEFQPLLDQTSNLCVGFEALLRLTDEDGERIPPDEFIPVAESIGEIERIGTWVLKTAMAQAAAWPDDLFVSVNLSVRQFESQELPELVSELLAQTGLPATRLELEVTESLLMHDTDKIGRQLADLRTLGVSIAMDDFGTGYSSLGYLWKFGFDKLKIDRSFIMGLADSRGQASDVLDAIIALGHRLHMVVTAEGIETEEQAEILSAMSCDQMQGFYFGRPMRPVDIAPFLLNNVAATQRDDKKTSVPKKARSRG
ncbi:GGDEF domain-containing phosphodiesterase [Devosia neptuniae]|jgi:diguanylate cyclase (GGDEF)-like protein|uniref:putative bifunctional diguanylate cyclase/phosphodiesterase n=1 Tax=Devosia TaxID=46913 RepID=UPI0022AFE98C|nr:GGDEF domain-containing phosphodiesterase [Devosia neptuniae]MCZ4344610.1 EAL domain-containing protein [Devosia neptuniae]|tara:strand:- start:19156 stop:21144 length:1989 start_codon:yes stop_codon:yes gene_type:complete